MQADQSLYLPEANVDCYRYDSSGRILQYGRQAVGFIFDKIAAGELWGYGVCNDETHYVELVGKNVPVLRRRPIIDWGFDKTELLPRQEATLADVPPGSVSFTGPVRGSQAHTAHGPVQIGWTTPGDYVVSVNAFPYLPASFKLTVRGKLPVSANVGVTV